MRVPEDAAPNTAGHHRRDRRASPPRLLPRQPVGAEEATRRHLRSVITALLDQHELDQHELDQHEEEARWASRNPCS